MGSSLRRPALACEGRDGGCRRQVPDDRHATVGEGASTVWSPPVIDDLCARHNLRPPADVRQFASSASPRDENEVSRAGANERWRANAATRLTEVALVDNGNRYHYSR
jgi:hypothetical protein